MSKYAFLGIAAILSAAGAAAANYANGTEETATGAEGGEGEPAKRGRGRPAGTGKPAEGETKTGPTDEERLTTNQALIKPLVDSGEGEAVKKVIAVYSKTGLKGLPADKQAEFEKDIAALTY